MLVSKPKLDCALFEIKEILKIKQKAVVLLLIKRGCSFWDTRYVFSQPEKQKSPLNDRMIQKTKFLCYNMLSHQQTRHHKKNLKCLSSDVYTYGRRLTIKSLDTERIMVESFQNAGTTSINLPASIICHSEL